MKGTTHTAIGLATISLISDTHITGIIHNPMALMPFAAGYISALICDIDTRSSTISNMVPIARYKRAVWIIITALAILLGVKSGKYALVVASIFIILLIFSPHRGYSHSILAVIISFGIIKYICRSYGLQDVSIYFMAGMLSHIVADLFTKEGVTLLFPYQKKLVFPLSITTGSPWEYLISVAAIGLFVVRLI